MTAERRLAKIETSLSPTQLVLRWLDEAHAFGDLESYVRSLFAGPVLEGPLDRLARQAERGARMSGVGTRPEVVNKAVRTALRETFFRYRARPAHQRRGPRPPRPGGPHRCRPRRQPRRPFCREPQRRARPTPRISRGSPNFVTCSSCGSGSFARRRRRAPLVEERYLAGHPALFPDAVTAWDAQCTRTKTLADVAVRLAELDGVPRRSPAIPATTSERALEAHAPTSSSRPRPPHSTNSGRAARQ